MSRIPTHVAQRISDLAQKYERDLTAIERIVAQKRGLALDALAGQGRALAIEAHARTYIIDPVLNELGWRIEAAEALLVEEGIDADPEETEGNRKFLDYHGRDVHDGTSLALIEAKRPVYALPVPDDGTIEFFFATALGLIFGKGPKKPSGLAGHWVKWFETLAIYIERIKRDFGATPKVVALTNGDWYLIFKDVEATFIEKKPSANTIIAFKNLDDVQARHELFYELLSYSYLSGFVPPQLPGAVRDFVEGGQAALCVRAMEIGYQAFGDRQPILSFRAAAWVKPSNGGWILFRREEPFVQFPHKEEEADRFLEQMVGMSDQLIGELSVECALSIISASEFAKAAEGDPFKGMHSKIAGTAVAFKSHQRREGEFFIIATGVEAVHQVKDSGYENCRFHSFGSCVQAGHGTTNIFAPTTEPRAFFPSGNLFHCAHALVHKKRERKCLLEPIDSFLCCQMCTLKVHCWGDEIQRLPCRVD